MGYRVILINPPGNNHWLPLALSYLKSSAPPRHEVKILDCTAENIRADSREFRAILDKFQPDLVGVSALTSTIEESLDIVRACKAHSPDILTIIGGIHATLCPEMVMKNEACDFVMRGEAELSFPAFLDVLGQEQYYTTINGLGYRLNGKVILNEIKLEDDLDKIKFPDYSFVLRKGWLNEGVEHYGIKAPLWLTRGCPYGCKFCSAPLVSGRKIRSHSLDYDVRWIMHLYDKYNVRHFSIIDDNFTLKIDYAKEFCRRVITLREKTFREPIHFENSNGVRMQFLDAELLDLMKRAGWREISLAPESGSRRTLERMNKKLDPDIVPGIAKMVREAGLNVFGGFIVGYPGETEDDIKDTIKLIRKCKFDNILIQQFCPLPGTPVFDELVAKGEISPNKLPSTFYLSYLSPKKHQQAEIYVTKDLKNFNFCRMVFWECFLLALRNPRFIINNFKSGRVKRLIRHMFFFKAKTPQET